jgi:hypothetical protein
MTETQQTPQTSPADHSHTAKPGEKQPVKIHRVCIGCNQMFEVTLDHYEAKHCSACHKA